MAAAAEKVGKSERPARSRPVSSGIPAPTPSRAIRPANCSPVQAACVPTSPSTGSDGSGPQGVRPVATSSVRHRVAEIVEGAPDKPLCRDMTDFSRLSVAKCKLEAFEISKDASRLGLTGCASQTVWKT